MIVPNFTFDADVNGYISEPIAIDDKASAVIELASRAPVVTLKQIEEGEFANFGQTPKSGTHFQINITCKKETIIRLATPVVVKKCYILN